MKKLIVNQKSLFLVVLFMLNTGCLLNDSEKKGIEDTVGTPPTYVPPASDYPELADNCYSQTSYQPQAEITKKIDLLFMTDTSGSLDTERPSIADGIDAFVAALPADADIRIGVMLAHAGTWSGKLYRYSNKGAYVLDNKTTSLSDIRTLLHERMLKVATENETDGGEIGLYSLSRALDSDRLTESKNLGFFRDDAALAVVFITDENDICARFPVGVVPVYDPDHKEGPAFNKYCQDVTAEKVYTKLRNFQGTRPLLVSGIVYFEDSVFPHSGENEIGYGITDIVRANEGLLVDLAGGRFYEGLEKIGSLVTKKLNLVTDYTLNDKGLVIDENSIITKIDGTDVPFQYNSTATEVHLTGYAGRENSEVYLSYCVNPSGNPETIPVVITKVKVINITSTAAAVTWTTDLFSSSQVEVTENLTGRKWKTTLNSTGVLNHSVALTGLTADTLYSIRVYSAIEGDPSVSDPVSFRTLR